MADYGINELLRISAIEMLTRLEALPKSPTLPALQQAEKTLRIVQRQTSTLYFQENTTQGQIVDALEAARQYSIYLMSNNRGSNVMLAARAVAQLASDSVVEIVSHPDYKPPRRYP